MLGGRVNVMTVVIAGGGTYILWVLVVIKHFWLVLTEQFVFKSRWEVFVPPCLEIFNCRCG